MLDPSTLTSFSLVTWSVPSDLCALSSGTFAEVESSGDAVVLVSEDIVALQREREDQTKR